MTESSSEGPGWTGAPIVSEAAAVLDAAALARDPVLYGAGVARGDGSPVLLLPGFMAGDQALAVLAGWLRRIGYRPRFAGIRLNADCSGATLERLSALLHARGERVAVIGQSRGGTLARALAARDPGLVSGIVTLGSPVRDERRVHPLVAGSVRRMVALGDAGMPGVLATSCFEGSCCTEFRRHLAAPLRSDVGYVSIYTRRDGIVDWRACLDPAARCIEIDSTHSGMGVHPRAYRTIAAALPEFAARR